MSASNQSRALHNPSAGARGDATCCICGEKGGHNRGCIQRQMEVEAAADLEAHKHESQAQQVQLQQQFPPGRTSSNGH